jgi:tetratricopeptide (TPR) repeat protein
MHWSAEDFTNFCFISKTNPARTALLSDVRCEIPAELSPSGFLAALPESRGKTGQARWRAILLILCISALICWSAVRKGFLGSLNALKPQVSSTASLMHLREAMVLADAGKAAPAESEFQKAIELAKAAGSDVRRSAEDQQAAYLMRGEARFVRSEFGPAKEDFSSVIGTAIPLTTPSDPAIATEDRSFIALFDRAIVRARTLDSQGAQSDLTMALAAIPDYSQQRLQWIKAQMKVERSSDSWLQHLEKAGRKDGYYYLVHGQQKMWQRDYVGAIPDFNRSMEMNFDPALNLQQRGACELFLGNAVASQADFTRANELQQNPGMLFFFRGVLRQVDGDYAAALKDYGEAERLSPNPEPRPATRRSAISTLYRYHTDWFSAAVLMLPQIGNVQPKIEGLAANKALCLKSRNRVR